MRSTSLKAIALALAAILLSPVDASIDTNREETFCFEIGFRPKTPEFANCVVDMFGKELPPMRRDVISQSFEVIASVSPPQADGSVTISIKANRPIARLSINGVEEGGRQDGVYAIKRLALAATETIYDIRVKDEHGTVKAQKLSVIRSRESSEGAVAVLEPNKIKVSQKRDAAALVIGIANYRRLPRADFSDVDGRLFYDYARLALGIPEENIKLLVNEDADRTSIRRALQAWLPSVVKKDVSEVFIFFSGHGLPSQSGETLFLMPWDADKDYIDDTAVSHEFLFQAVAASKPKHVSVFLDSCYSGQSRTGETLLAGARPVLVRARRGGVPENFSMMSASAADELSLSSPRLKHGIFSFYLMKGLEGEADANKDGRITSGELFEFVKQSVEREAARNGRKQTPTLIGNSEQLLGRIP